MAQTNVQAFSGDVEISGETVLGTATYRKKLRWNRNELAYVYLGNIQSNKTTGIRLDVSLNASNSGYEMYQFQIVVNGADSSHAGGKMIYSALGGNVGSILYKSVEIGYVYVGSGGAYEYQLWLKDPTTDITGFIDVYLNCQEYYNFDTGVSDVAQGGAAPTNFNLGTPGVVVDKFGNVGIGTNVPDNALHIRNAIPAVLLDDADDNTEVRIAGGSGGDLYVDSNWGGSGNTGDIIFREASSEKMRITGSGNVGIGTNSPVSGLTVYKDIESSNSFITERVLFRETWPNGLNSLVGDLGTWVVTNLNQQSNPSITTTPDGYGIVAFNGNDGSNGNFVSPAFDLSDYAIVDGTTPADDKRKTTTRVFMKFWLGTRQLDADGEVLQVQFSPNNGTTWYTVATSQDRLNAERFTMVSADLSPYILGTSTNAKIRFYLPWTAQSGDYIRIGRIWIHESDVPTNLGGMWLGAGGNIGIGTTSPDHHLHVMGTGGARIGVESTSGYGGLEIGGSSGGLIDFKTPFSDDYDARIIYSGGNLQFTGADVLITENLFAEGNVGIGTNAPIGKLDVRGAILAPVVSYFSNQDAPYLIAGTSGYTGEATNWDTYGFQHRIKTNSSGVPRITVDTSQAGEAFSIVNNGNVGIGTNDPQGQLHISSGTSGDCVMILQADTDNNNENDNPRIEFWQDGSIAESAIRQSDNYLDIMNSVTTLSGIRFFTGGDTSGYTNAVERIHIDESGRVGIGTNNPECMLQLSASTSSSNITDPIKLKIHNRRGAGDWSSTQPWGLLEFDTNDTSGSGTGPVAGVGCRFESVGGGSASLCFYTDHDNSDNNVLGAANERMCIDHDGRVGIGTTNPAQKLDVVGDILASGNVTAYSDRRLKSDIERIEGALDKVCALGGYTFTMNDKRSTGLIAQEVKGVLPEAVHGSEETHYSLAYGNILGLIVEAIKELKEKIG